MNPPVAPHVRRSVWTLPTGDTTIADYAKAVEIMKARKPDDPTSWSYQAAMHGSYHTPARQLWNGCEHQTWYFVCWHRMFLYHFEQIVRAAVVQAGGSADWALPFWNYCAGGQQATLPVAFRHPTSNGTANPLYVAARNPQINLGLALQPAVTSPAHALSRPAFTGVAQFGGGVTPLQPFSAPPGGNTGQLEYTPHNDVHGTIGGWMGDPGTAAADPIFWLHHSNIDRLWDIWAHAPHTNPTKPAWVGQKFSFFDTSGQVVQMTPADVLDITGQLGYTYEIAPPAAPIAPPPAPPAVEDLTLMPPTPEPELVGRSQAPVTLVGVPASVTIEIDAQAAHKVQGDQPLPSHVYLSVEEVTGDKNPDAVYGIYLNLPEGAAAKTAESHHAANLSFFGLQRAQHPLGDEPPHGLAVTKAITSLVRQLAADGEWDGQHVTVTFRPLGLIPHDQPELAHALPEQMSDDDPPVQVSQVSILYA
jgi:tyrosinase